MDPSPALLTRRWFAPALAVAGLALLMVAYVAAWDVRGSSPTGAILLVESAAYLGVALQVAAIGASLAGAFRHRRVPVVAVVYGVGALVAGASVLWGRYQVAQRFRDDPSLFSVEPNADGQTLDVRSGAGRWSVAFRACPASEHAARASVGTRQQNGVAEISLGDDPPYMRLHVAERRVECLSPTSR